MAGSCMSIEDDKRRRKGRIIELSVRVRVRLIRGDIFVWAISTRFQKYVYCIKTDLKVAHKYTFPCIIQMTTYKTFAVHSIRVKVYAHRIFLCKQYNLIATFYET